MAEQKTDAVPTLEYEGVVFRFPWWNALRPLNDGEVAALETSLKEAGEVTSPVLLVEDTHDVLDGAHRLILARKLGFALDDLPLHTVRGLKTDEQKRERACSLNYDRRQFTPEELAARAEERRERVRQKRAGGQSVRQIAESEGVGKATVERDLASGVPGGTPDESAHPEAETGAGSSAETNGTVTGKDGKTYPAKKPKKAPPEPEPPPPEPEPDPLAQAKEAACLVEFEEVSIRDAAKRVDMAESTLRGQLQKPEVRAHVEAERQKQPKDELGQFVPYRLREIFSLRPKFKEAEQRQKDQTTFLNFLGKLPDFGQGAGRMWSDEPKVASQNIFQWVSRAAPFAVCPACKGKKCPAKPRDAPLDTPDPNQCGQRGWLTFDGLKELSRNQRYRNLFDPCPDCGGDGKSCKTCHGIGQVVKG